MVPRSAASMRKAPAANFLPFASNGSSAALILTFACLKRNVTRLLSVVCSTTMTLPSPMMPPGAFTSPVTGDIAADWIALSVHSTTWKLRISCVVHPVSSYGRGLAAG